MPSHVISCLISRAITQWLVQSDTDKADMCARKQDIKHFSVHFVNREYFGAKLNLDLKIPDLCASIVSISITLQKYFVPIVHY